MFKVATQPVQEWVSEKMFFKIIYSYLSSGPSHVKLKIVSLHGNVSFLEFAGEGRYYFQLECYNTTLLYATS